MEITRIISAFPGTGKTFYHKLHPDTTLDSDSSNFSWIRRVGKENIKNPEFPNNYIKHIQENIGKYDFIFVSSHKEVRDALKHNCLFFYLIYPKPMMKDIYIQRYKDRNSPQSFIDLLSANWDNWINQCEFEEFGCKNIRMVFPALEDEISSIIAIEHGEIREN